MALGRHSEPKQILRNRVLLLLSYYRTYATQDVAAEVFGVGQATVSRSIDQIAPVVRQCIPIPATIHDRAKRASALEELEEILPGLRCLIDASEQQVQRSKRKNMEKSHYSGKAGRHTAKVQYTVSTNGLKANPQQAGQSEEDPVLRQGRFGRCIATGSVVRAEWER